MTKTVRELEQELDELRAALAAVGGVTTDTAADTVTDADAPALGDIVHVLVNVPLAGEMRYRGQSIEVDAKILKLDIDRDGHSTIARLLRKGVLGHGPFDAEQNDPWTAPGDEFWSKLYVEARDRARALPDPTDRRAAEAALLRRFGPVPDDWREPPTPVRSKWSY